MNCFLFDQNSIHSILNDARHREVKPITRAPFNASSSRCDLEDSRILCRSKLSHGSRLSANQSSVVLPPCHKAFVGRNPQGRSAGKKIGICVSILSLCSVIGGNLDLIFDVLVEDGKDQGAWRLTSPSRADLLVDGADLPSPSTTNGQKLLPYMA